MTFTWSVEIFTTSTTKTQVAQVLGGPSGVSLTAEGGLTAGGEGPFFNVDGGRYTARIQYEAKPVRVMQYRPTLNHGGRRSACTRVRGEFTIESITRVSPALPPPTFRPPGDTLPVDMPANNLPELLPPYGAGSLSDQRPRPLRPGQNRPQQ